MGPKDQILARMYVVLTLLSLLPLLVAGQVLWIFLSEGEQLRAQGQRQANTHVEIPAMRGAILDRAGRTLAVNAARYDLALDPTVSGFSDVRHTFFERLSKLTGIPVSRLRRKVERRPSPKYVLLARGLSEEQKEAIDAWATPGVILEPKFTRRYNYGSAAAHVLGHVDVDGRGKAGVELQYEEHLRGVPGRRTVQRDRRGVIRAVVEGTVVEPKHGETLVLTIDLIRQTILEEELRRGVTESGSRWGTAVAMDPHTGAILALANVPTYDPNRPGAYPDAARRNHAITDRMEPGSTFKLVAAAAAVEKGIVSLQDSIETGAGWAVFGGRTMRDTRAHGTITFADVIARSSNVGVARVASRLEPGDLYQYARNLGFGQPTWIDLPGEVSGTLKRPSQWSGTTLTSMSIGYEVDVTPLQLLAAYSALANGGLLVQPHVVAERRDLTGRTIWKARPDSIRRVFEESTARALLPAFEQVVNEGTAEQAQLEGLPVAGKTGTARKVEDGSYAQGSYRATFVGFFPADDPKVAMIVVMDEPETSIYGGAVAAPVFQRIARRWIATFPDIARRIAPPDTLPEHVEQPVPDVTARPVALAARRLRAAGFRVESAPDALETVEMLKPEAGTTLPSGAHVRLVLDAEKSETAEEVLPDLEGWSSRDAIFWLHAHGVQVRVEGRGRVVRQTPPAGTPLPREVILRCE